MKRHRVAIVGCGRLAQVQHLPHCQQNDRIDLVCTCDINKETAKTCKERFDAKRYETDWRNVVEADDIDMAILATHTNLRGDFIIPALKSGIPVYTEKPLAPSQEEMVKIVLTSRKTGVPVCVGHNRRSSPAVLEMKRLFDKALKATDVTTPSVMSNKGKVVPEEHQIQMLFRVCDDSRSWKDWVFLDEEGIMFAEMVHFIDLALWLNPTNPVRVFSEGSNRGNFTFIIRFQDGSITTIQHTMVGNFDYPKELFELTANNVTVAMEQHFEVRQVGLLDEPLVQTFPFSKPSFAEGEGMMAYMRAIEKEQQQAKTTGDAARFLGVEKGHFKHLDRFLDHLEGKGENPCDIESAVNVTKIALKLLESTRLGLPLAINPQDWHMPTI
jgi:predicted dehydrogenase